MSLQACGDETGCDLKGMLETGRNGKRRVITHCCCDETRRHHCVFQVDHLSVCLVSSVYISSPEEGQA